MRLASSADRDGLRQRHLAGDGTLRAFELVSSGACAGPAMGARPGTAAQAPLGVITKAAALVTPAFFALLAGTAAGLIAACSRLRAPRGWLARG